MDKIARLRQEIERRIKIYHESNHGFSLRCDECEELLSFLDTLSEEPDKSLEEAAEEYEQTRQDTDARSDNEIVRRSFIAGADWQASQMPMPEDTVLFQKGVAEGRRLEREDMMKEAVAGTVHHALNCHYIMTDQEALNARLRGIPEGTAVNIFICKAEEEQ